MQKDLGSIAVELKRKEDWARGRVELNTITTEVSISLDAQEP
jgi:hypothetical protein